MTQQKTLEQQKQELIAKKDEAVKRLKGLQHPGPINKRQRIKNGLEIRYLTGLVHGYKDSIERINSLIETTCRKQRENCAEAFRFSEGPAYRTRTARAILNAPSPNTGK